MRWHVQGTDPHTGMDVELAVNDPDATQAVQSAINRQIVVKTVRPGTAKPRPRFLVPLTLALTITLGATCAGLYIYNQTLRHSLDQSAAEQHRLAASLAQNISTPPRAPAASAPAEDIRAAQLQSDLAAARTQLTQVKQQLESASTQSAALQKYALQVPVLENQRKDLLSQLAQTQKQLADLASAASKLRAELDMQNRRTQEIQSTPAAPSVQAAAQLAALQKENAALTDQVEKLKAELLLLAAKPPAPPVPVEAAPVVPARPARWALDISFLKAQEFLLMHTESTELSRTPAADPDTFETISLMPEHAVKITLLHDKSRDHIFTARLSVSLAADAPPAILADNKTTTLEFLKAFAPSAKDPAAILASAATLTPRDPSRRQVFLASNVRITLWNDTTGACILLVSPSYEDN